MRNLGEVAERLRRSTVQVLGEDRRSGGSGVVWSAAGVILTNAHVARTPSLRVKLWDGRQFDARLTVRDPRRDLAAVQVKAEGLEAATPGESEALRPGELVLAVGNPMGFQGAVSTGVVHSIGRLPGMGREPWIRADVRLAPGNSGGPLANAQGQVVGINTAIMNGLGVAAMISTASHFLRHGARPALGVTLRPVRSGLLVLELEGDGAASAASLRRGDILLYSLEELNDHLDTAPDVLRLRFLRGRGDSVREVAVRLQRPARAA